MTRHRHRFYAPSLTRGAGGTQAEKSFSFHVYQDAEEEEEKAGKYIAADDAAGAEIGKRRVGHCTYCCVDVRTEENLSLAVLRERV